MTCNFPLNCELLKIDRWMRSNKPSKIILIIDKIILIILHANQQVFEKRK